jgi:hypothetical protein
VRSRERLLQGIEGNADQQLVGRKRHSAEP